MNVYNTVAELCSLIITSCTEEFFVHYSCISNAEKFRINELIFEKIPVLFEKETERLRIFEVHQLSEEDLTDEFFDSLKALSDKLYKNQYYFAIVGLIQILDEAVESLLKKKYNGAATIIFLHFLGMTEPPRSTFSLATTTSVRGVGPNHILICFANSNVA